MEYVCTLWIQQMPRRVRRGGAEVLSTITNSIGWGFLSSHFFSAPPHPTPLRSITVDAKLLYKVASRRVLEICACGKAKPRVHFNHNSVSKAVINDQRR